VFQPKILLPSTINIPSLQNDKSQAEIRTPFIIPMYMTPLWHVEREWEREERERESFGLARALWNNNFPNINFWALYYRHKPNYVNFLPLFYYFAIPLYFLLEIICFLSFRSDHPFVALELKKFTSKWTNENRVTVMLPSSIRWVGIYRINAMKCVGILFNGK
jgi:hypothetical protein